MSRNSNAMMAFVAGVAAGAAAVFFSDEGRREQAKKAAVDAVEKAKQVAQDPKAYLQSASEAVGETMEDVKDRTSRATKAAKKELSKPIK